MVRETTPETCDEAETMRAARQRYFEVNGFDGNYTERWVKLRVGRLVIAFPNAPGRQRAVRLHDLHHVVTGYATTWTGEAEIAAFEIASGCGRFAWAWVLNLQAFAVGLLIAPSALFAAFVRGRHARNLYQQGDFCEALLEPTVSEMRRALGLSQPPPRATPRDRAVFLAWSAVSVAWIVVPVAAVVWWCLV
jgi:hypothetical protein